MLGFNHFGTFLLFVAFALLLVSSISAPVINSIALAKATVGVSGVNATINLGTLGYCLELSGSTSCSATSVGYELPSILSSLVSDNTQSTIRIVTKILVLHPVACGIAFLAFLISACSDRLGFLFASLITALAAVVALIAMILDLVLFKVVKSYLNNIENVDVDINYSIATWLTVAAFACLFVATFAVACSSLSSRRNRRRNEKW